MAKEKKRKTVKAKKVREGDFIPGLDNAYVFTAPEAGDGAWETNVYFHDQNGEEGRIVCDGDMPIEVER